MIAAVRAVLPTMDAEFQASIQAALNVSIPDLGDQQKGAGALSRIRCVYELVMENKPLSDEDLMKLPLLRMRNNDKHDVDFECLECRETMVTGAAVMRLPCGKIKKFDVLETDTPLPPDQPFWGDLRHMLTLSPSLIGHRMHRKCTIAALRRQNKCPRGCFKRPRPT